MTSSDSPVPGEAHDLGTGATTCQSCGHDADLHSASWGCLYGEFEYPNPHSYTGSPTTDGTGCGCMVPRSRILGDAA